MAEEIKFNKTVYSKTQYEKTINTSFTQLGVKSIQEQIDEQPNLDEFFSQYNSLFYEIPELGDTNSHEFLIKTSGDYIKSDAKNDEIAALQDEIASLREELLETQQQLIDTPTVKSPLK